MEGQEHKSLFSGNCVKCDAWELTLREYIILPEVMIDKVIFNQLQVYENTQSALVKDEIFVRASKEEYCRYFPGAHSNLDDFLPRDHMNYNCVYTLYEEDEDYFQKVEGSKHWLPELSKEDEIILDSILEQISTDDSWVNEERMELVE